MKKLLWCVLLLSALFLCLTSCNQESEETERCNHILTEVKEIKTATCTEEGKTRGRCTVCRKFIYGSIPKIPHEVTVSAAQKATCVTDGLGEGKSCAMCGKVFKYREVTPATGHAVTKGKDACVICNATPSEGLAYALSADGAYYTVKGMGTCQDTDLWIPTTYNGIPVKEIDIYAFRGCETLQSVVIPTSIVNIQTSAFQDCTELKTLIIGKRSSLRSIGSYAFSNTDITGCRIPYGVRFLGENAFRECHSLLSVEFGKMSGLQRISDYAFYGCENLWKVTLHDYLKSIGEYAFSNCQALSDIAFPKKLTVIEACAFMNCDGLEKLVISGKIERVGENAFKDCDGLLSVTVSNGVKSLGGSAFRECQNLKNVKIAGSVKIIRGGTFAGCKNLEKVILKRGVEKIEKYAFLGCGKVIALGLPRSIKTIEGYAFSKCGVMTVHYGGGKWMWDMIDIDQGTKTEFPYAEFKYNSRLR